MRTLISLAAAAVSLSMAAGAHADERDPTGAAQLAQPAAPGGLWLDGEAGVTNSLHADSLHGIRGGVVYAVSALRLGPVAAYDQLFYSGIAFRDAEQTADVYQLGARAGWGAPFSEGLFGAWLEMGVSWANTISGIDEASAAPYGRAEIVLQLPVRAPVRPYLAAAGTVVTSQLGGDAESAMLLAGLAWRAW